MEDTRFIEMIQRAQSGEQEAADCLFVACHSQLRAFVARKLDGTFARAGIDPEDVLQEAFVAAWTDLGNRQFGSFRAFVAWMKIIARNKLIDLKRNLLAEKNDVRRVANCTGDSPSAYADMLARIASLRSTPSHAAARGEALALLSGQIWRLPEEYRQVIQWRFVQGLPVTEVARLLGRSDAAVHMLCHRALKKLRELMGSPSKYLSR